MSTNTPSDKASIREKQLSVFAKVVEANKEQLEQDLKSIIGELSEEGSRPAVSEMVFREVFLPFFCNDNPLPYPVELGHWLAISKNPFKSVDVINENGDVLFTVPPIASRDSLAPLDDRAIDIGNIVWHAQQVGNVSQAHADNYIANAMIPQSDKMLVGARGAILADVKAWNEIFLRYGRPVIAINDEKPAEKKREDPGFDYDEWETL